MITELLPWIIGMVSLAIAGLTIFFYGKKSERLKQEKKNAEISAKQRDIATDPRPTTTDDRNSMRDGKF